jgi:uncharacterized protein YutE (UPF0331/DUF86 family)
MVDQTILKKRMIQINESLKMIELYLNKNFEEFIHDKIIQNVVEYNLFIIINQMVEIASHIVIDNGYGTVETMSDGFRVQNQRGLIPAEDMETYIRMVGFRNIISHQYISLSKEIVFDVAKNRLVDVKKFLIMLNENFV